MDRYYQPIPLDPHTFAGQFMLTKDAHRIPDGWQRQEQAPWILGTLKLPVMTVENLGHQVMGWCIGHPVHLDGSWPDKVTLRCQDHQSIDMAAVENFYEHTAGRYALVLLTQDAEKLFLDPYGSLSAVYSLKEPTVASTPTLLRADHAWDREMITVLNMPESGRWFPSGLTSRQMVRRLLPNHCLDLKAWRVSRHWPASNADLAVKENPQEGVSTIIASLQKTIGAITQKFPLQLPLTAGRDSRMVLACSREFLEQTTFHTFTEKKETVDMYIAARLAQRLNLNHAFIPFRDASDTEMRQWLYITGHCVSGFIWKTHKSLSALDPNRVLLNGMAGELGKGFYWRREDREQMRLSAKELVARFGLPSHARIVGEAGQWLAGVSSLNAFNILDLGYLEQRLACWAAPQHYGNQFAAFEVSPFNQRQIVRATMRFPYAYRRRKGLSRDICGTLWPELLELPFNEFLGIRNYIHKARKHLSKTTKSSVSTVKRGIKRLLRSD